MGTISIDFEIEDSFLVLIKYRDDGRGLNIGKSKQIALVRALFDDPDTTSLSDLAELIFCSGLSTANRIMIYLAEVWYMRKKIYHRTG